MRTWTLGPTVATLLLGVGAAAQQAAAEPCKGPKCGAPQRDGPRARARESALLTSRARSGVYELPAAPAAPAAEARPASPASETPAAEARPPAAPENPHDVAGLADTHELVSEPAALAAARATHMNRALRTHASTPYAAPLTASQDTCMGARTFGVQFMGFGVSFATTWQDRQCRRLKNARELFALGHREAAVQLLCLDDEVYAAMERAGTPCPLVQFTRAEPAPPPPEQAEPPPLFSFDDVLFDFDRSTLRPEANRILDPLLAMLRADPSMHIDIEGHTDWVGADAYNQGLSERRARAVVNWLVAHGISRDRLTSEGRGESEPVASNATREGRQLNRRVEIHRL